jgi:hypothetical protein
MAAKTGRKKGSYSFVMVLGSELKKSVKDTDMVVLSSKYAASAGIEGQPVKTVAGSNLFFPTEAQPIKLAPKTVKEDNEDSATLQIDVQDW